MKSKIFTKICVMFLLHVHRFRYLFCVPFSVHVPFLVLVLCPDFGTCHLFCVPISVHGGIFMYRFWCKYVLCVPFLGRTNVKFDAKFDTKFVMNYLIVFYFEQVFSRQFTKNCTAFSS